MQFELVNLEDIQVKYWQSNSGNGGNIRNVRIVIKIALICKHPAFLVFKYFVLIYTIRVLGLYALTKISTESVGCNEVCHKPGFWTPMRKS